MTELERFHHLRQAGELEAALAAAAAAFLTHPGAELAEAACAVAEAVAPDCAAHWHECAGRERSARGRYAEAAGHFERVLALHPLGEDRHRIRFLLSTAHLRAGLPPAVERVHAQALADHPPPEWRSRLLSNEAARRQTLGDLEGSRAPGEQALAQAEAAGDAEAAGLAAHVLTYSLIALGDHDAAESMAERAAEAYARAGHVMGQIRALGARAAVAHARQKRPEAERLCREALERARALGMRLGMEEQLSSLARILLESGRWDESRAVLAEAARLALEDHRPRGAALAMANLAHTDGLAGRPRLARREARAAVRLCRAHLPRLEAWACRSLAQAYRIAGKLGRAERAARRSLELAMALGRTPMQGHVGEEMDWCRIEYGRTLQARGRWKEAAELWESGLRSRPPEGSVASTILGALAGRAALRQGDPAAATARLGSAEAWLESHPAPYAAALVCQLKAELALSQGRSTEAMALAERTLIGLLALPAPADRAEALLEFGRLAFANRSIKSPVVGSWLEQAAGAFERLGDHRSRERALALEVEWLRGLATAAGAGSRDRDLIEAVSQLLHSLSDLRELTQRAMQMVVDQLDAERGVLLLVEPDSGRLVPMAERGAVDAATRSHAVGYSRRAVQRVTESGGSLLIGDAASDPRGLSESVLDLHLRSIVCVPMYLGGRVIGAVYLDDSRRAQAFSDADRGLLEGFAHLMAVAIEKSRGDEEVRRTNEMLVGENLTLRKEATVHFQADRLIGVSLEMQRMRALIERAALTPSTVLLTGENGTGKELIARILHHHSKRRLQPFVVVNCGAIPESLLESELFGILANVATGVRRRDGRFKQADQGTLFLDEIADMPLKQQVALLTALSSREITPVGGGKPIPVDVRIMAATHRDLRRLVEEGTFREDLYYRLNVIPIEVPPLRERKADIPALAQYFVTLMARIQERPVPEMSTEFLAALMQSDWPGNVRELQNYIERVMAMSPGGVLKPMPPPCDLEDRASVPKTARRGRLTDLVADLERRLVQDALKHAGGNQSLAARHLGVPEQAIRYRIKKYGLLSTRQNRRTRVNWRYK